MYIYIYTQNIYSPPRKMKTHAYILPHSSDSTWVLWYLKSPATRLFGQKRFRLTTKETSSPLSETGIPHEGTIMPKPFPWPLARYVKLWVAHAPGMPGTFSHCGLAIPTCITARAWRTCRDACRDGSQTSGFLWSRWRGKTFPAFPAHGQRAHLRIW